MSDDDYLLLRRRRRDDPPGPLGLHAADPENTSVLRETPPGPLGSGEAYAFGDAAATRLVPRIGHILGAGVPPAPVPEAPPSPPPGAARRVEKTDWIEIQLVDMQDNPVRNERWGITWPDGSTVSEGRTDHRGMGRIDWIDPSGMCEITFPDLDREAWERVS